MKIFAALLTGALIFMNCASGAEASRVITDEAGDKVTVPDKIERIAVAGILPFPSVITVFLGSAEKLVGIPPASMGAAKAGLLGELFPEILKAQTGYTAGLDLNIEELMKLRPDVVFYLAGNKEMWKMIKNAGLPAVAISPTKWNYDVLRTYDEWIKTLSQIFPESAKSKEVSRYSKKVYADIQKKVGKIKPADRKKALFLFQYDDKRMVTSGRSFFGQYWCDAVGARNAAEEVPADNSNAVITMEQVYKWNPDVIFITNFTPALPEDLYGNKIGGHDWSAVKAVKERAVYKMPLGTYRSYTPGVDTPVTMMWMAQKVYHELFKEVDMRKEVRNYYKKLYGITLSDRQIEQMYNQGRGSAAGFIK
ncbi:ABC transporter substrate-binding protein [Cloacibacillus evryensis]|uniref:ABC transporter substrate-binding protein n=1 Tax=Cloacibacillus evryensis TaxID=508460 RepID=UPI0026DF732C|nr:ABC transporter substrate-binding protein [Cloacibacillus evryensis]